MPERVTVGFENGHFFLFKTSNPAIEPFGAEHLATGLAGDVFEQGAVGSERLEFAGHRFGGPARFGFSELLSGLPPAPQELWIVLLGHGTFDGKEAKFNMAGPDLSAAQAAELLRPIQRPLVLINCTSASAPFIPALAAPNRIVITATRSGFEENYAHFGRFLSTSIASLSADIDKDDQVSLLEAFLAASHRTEEFYKTEKRLATEHALIDDNGDGKGTAASFFRGVRPVAKSDDDTPLDGFRAHQVYFVPNADEALLTADQRARRNELEQKLESMRPLKKSMPEAQYLEAIEPILLELGRIYEEAARNK